MAQIWDAATGAELARLDHGHPVVSVEFSPDGRRLATREEVSTGEETSVTRLWDVESGTELYTLEQDGWIRSLAFSLDGTAIAAGGGEVGEPSTAIIWELP